MSNFVFLKKIDKDLFNIISEAEKLYRDEYFEQCISQTRRFGENICKNVVGTRCTAECSFDEMLATLKDKASKEQEKEFIEDLYFLKKQGNSAVHSSKVKKDGIVALECLQRAFEAAINYAVYYTKSDSSVLKNQFDINLLVTGKKNTKTLAEKYEVKKRTTKSVSNKKQSYTMKTKSSSKKEGLSLFQILLIISFIISGVVMLALLGQ